MVLISGAMILAFGSRFFNWIDGVRVLVLHAGAGIYGCYLVLYLANSLAGGRGFDIYSVTQRSGIYGFHVKW